MFLIFGFIIEALHHRLDYAHTASVIRQMILTPAFFVILTFSYFHLSLFVFGVKSGQFGF